MYAFVTEPLEASEARSCPASEEDSEELFLLDQGGEEAYPGGHDTDLFYICYRFLLGLSPPYTPTHIPALT